MADSMAVEKSDPAEVSREHRNPSGIVLKDDHVQVWWFYTVCAVVLIAAGVVVPVTVHDGPWLAVMALMGSVIIIALLSAAAVPHLRQARRGTHH